MTTTSLVVGGTGVTGSFIVMGLLKRGHTVTVIHSGRHKPAADIAPWYHDNSVRILFSSPDDPEELHSKIIAADGESFFFDHVFVLYGNLRKTNPIFVGHCARFYAATGCMAYDTWGCSTRNESVGGQMLAPLTEATSLMTTDGTLLTGTPNSFNPKLDKITLGEQSVFHNHPEATIIQYGKIYGPYNLMPTQWIVVKRILDKRKGIIVSPFSNGIGIFGSSCYAENAAEYFLLATENEASKGEVFIATEDKHFTIKQWIILIANALDQKDFQIIELPTKIAIPARPLDHNGFINDQAFMGGANMYYSNEKAHRLLGYKDVVDPVEGVRKTAQWLAKPENHPSTKVMSKILQDPFDYEMEDKLLCLWNEKKDWNGCLALEWKVVPGWGHFWYGPGANPGDEFKGDLKKKYSGKFDRDVDERKQQSKL